ncbi:shikimate dehydrogenase [Amorphoplanes nipponensis]
MIHSAGFAAAGLLTWSYTAIECAEAELAGLVAGLGPEWAGLSLTMPLKEVGLTLAAAASPVAGPRRRGQHPGTPPRRQLVRRQHRRPGHGPGAHRRGPEGVPGRHRNRRGRHGRAALAAAARFGADEVTVVTRRPQARAELAPAAAALGVTIRGVDWADAPAAFDADAVIDRAPRVRPTPWAAAAPLAAVSVLFDAIYDPWPTPLAAAAAAHGVPVVSGLDLLLAQALSQFEQFTGVVPAPEGPMRAALTAAAAVR